VSITGSGALRWAAAWRSEPIERDVDEEEWLAEPRRQYMIEMYIGERNSRMLVERCDGQQHGTLSPSSGMSVRRNGSLSPAGNT